MSDLVEQLRDKSDHLPLGWNDTWKLMLDAADEIERLRAERSHLPPGTTPMDWVHLHDDMQVSRDILAEALRNIVAFNGKTDAVVMAREALRKAGVEP